MIRSLRIYSLSCQKINNTLGSVFIPVWCFNLNIKMFQNLTFKLFSNINVKVFYIKLKKSFVLWNKSWYVHLLVMTLCVNHLIIKCKFFKFKIIFWIDFFVTQGPFNMNFPIHFFMGFTAICIHGLWSQYFTKYLPNKNKKQKRNKKENWFKVKILKWMVGFEIRSVFCCHFSASIGLSVYNIIYIIYKIYWCRYVVFILD